MALAYTHFQAFLRCMLQKADSAWETDVDVVRLKLDTLIKERFDSALENGSTVVSSNIAVMRIRIV